MELAENQKRYLAPCLVAHKSTLQLNSLAQKGMKTRHFLHKDLFVNVWFANYGFTSKRPKFDDIKTNSQTRKAKNSEISGFLHKTAPTTPHFLKAPFSSLSSGA